MSESCKIPRCPKAVYAICKCCEKHLCKYHVDEHNELLLRQLNPITDDINSLTDEIKSFDRFKPTIESREKLERWRIECHQKIDELFERKCQELDQYVTKKLSRQTERIEQVRLKMTQLNREQDLTRQDINLLTTIVNSIKKDMNSIQYTSIEIRTFPLQFQESLLQITETIRPKFDLSTISTPSKTITHSNKSFPVLASNYQYLLVHQGSKLALINQELNIVREVACSINNLLDIYWSTTLDRFILLNDNNFSLFDQNLLVIEKIPSFSNNKWFACTCSDKSLYLSTNELGSSIHEFNLLPRIQFLKQWSCPFTCKQNERIDTLVYNNETLALVIRNLSDKSLRIELRFSETLDYLWSLPLDIKCNKDMPYHCCLLNFDEWIITDYEKCRLLHITKSGQVKSVMKYNKVAPYRIHLFNYNLLVIWTKNGKNFHPLV